MYFTTKGSMCPAPCPRLVGIYLGTILTKNIDFFEEKSFCLSVRIFDTINDGIIFNKGGNMSELVKSGEVGEVYDGVTAVGNVALGQTFNPLTECAGGIVDSTLGNYGSDSEGSKWFRGSGLPPVRPED
jgi:hypothetical protein